MGSNTGKQPVKSALKQPNADKTHWTTAAAQAAQAQPAPSQAQLPGGSLLDGEFNEGESHAGFLEALKAFRGEKTDTAEESSKSVRFQGENDQPAAKKFSLAGLGGNEINVNCLPEPPTFADGGTKPDAQM